MQKQKKSKTVTIGNSSTPIHVNDVGSPHLHKHHEVVIRVFNNTKVGRAIVLDQHLIDVLFHHDQLDTRQHNVCDKYLGIFSHQQPGWKRNNLTLILFLNTYRIRCVVLYFIRSSKEHNRYMWEC